MDVHVCCYIYIHVGPLPETPRGNKYIITVTDYFSKWPEAAPLPDKTAVGVANFLFSIFCRHGWPERIISDQGREFVNAVTRYRVKNCTVSEQTDDTNMCNKTCMIW